MKPLSPSDFRAPALTRADARATVPYLADDAFDARWNAAVDAGALHVLRSFPALWWRDLRAVDPARVPAGRTVAFGDAHVENFGFLAFDKGGLGFAFNDLDDSGDVEVALDALRYFTSAAMWAGAGAPADVPALAAQWATNLGVDRDPVITDKATLAALDAPERRKMRAAAVRRWSTEDVLDPVTDDALAALRAALAGYDETRGYTVHAVRRRVVKDGGSGGLLRYWALARVPDGGPDDLDVLELKAKAPAASEEGDGARKLDKRLTAVKKAVWPERALTPYRRVEVSVGGETRSFVVRSRGARANVKRPSLAEQVRVLAAVHRRATFDLAHDALGRWVAASVPALVARWAALHALGR